MSAICVYLSLPPYLAQWYAHTCRKQRHREDDICPNQPIPLLTPVEPIRGSYESQVLHRVLQKQPSDVPEPIPADATLALAIPSYSDRDPRVFNYIGTHAKLELQNAILESFDICLWQELHTFRVRLNRQDHAIWAFMEKHGISCDEPNWNAIAKRYQRKRDIVYKINSRKKRSVSSRKNPKHSIV